MIKKSYIIAAMLPMLTCYNNGYSTELDGTTPASDSGDAPQTTTIQQDLVPEAKLDPNYNLGHFTWGADLGSAIDLSANDMTSIDLHGYFGYKDRWLRFLGVGAGVNSMISNQSRCYPVYAMVRTSFSSKPQLCFLDARIGLSFNNIMAYQSQTDFYGTIGIGITLAKGRKFSSHIILSYTFMPLQPFYTAHEVPITDSPGELFEGEEIKTVTSYEQEIFPDMHFASIRIGCSF
jgi:hypothetical protein